MRKRGGLRTRPHIGIGSRPAGPTRPDRRGIASAWPRYSSARRRSVAMRDKQKSVRRSRPLALQFGRPRRLPRRSREDADRPAVPRDGRLTVGLQGGEEREVLDTGCRESHVDERAVRNSFVMRGAFRADVRRLVGRVDEYPKGKLQ
jgi:hypothetical protein